ncbi:SDR family oxidoreductase [Gordonia insulae]|uniref:2-(R)-hydroxypropyl-CoM dehydrogenase n=1 Tax=Gordonia insulae TaxID=2420509 RepID=A0A3G8JQP7_9ACTN|nr:SDR family oxidoreductase [Gordonia insulae]AZG46782.1 2-(R)-hydroxypropyl-CoM dehydrogenase [Gordonia insulae]
MLIDGHNILVTGASSGLGVEFVTQALHRGAAKVYAAARRDITHPDPRVIALHLDVTDADSIAAAAAAAPDVDVLINNAGRHGATSLLTSPMAEIRDVFDTNVFGVLEMTRAFAPALAARGGGAVIDIASALSWIATPGAYSSSKAALWGLTNSLRAELAGQGTQVLGAHLSYAATPMTDGLTDAPKLAPETVIKQILDDLERGADESIVDDITAAVRASLATTTTAALTA